MPLTGSLRIRSLVVLLSLSVVSCSQVNYRDSERCARVYGPEVERIRRERVPVETREVATINELLAAAPVEKDLRRIIEHGVGYAYSGGDDYVGECERRLKSQGL